MIILTNWKMCSYERLNAVLSNIYTYLQTYRRTDNVICRGCIALKKMTTNKGKFCINHVKGGAKGPGIFFVIPCIDSYKKVDLRTVSFDVPPQEVS